MTWVKLDDRHDDHPKVLAAGPLAAWLHVCSITYAARNLTDGFIPYGAVGRLADWQAVPEVDVERLAQRLVAARLWEDAEGGYQIHDYLDYQPSRAEVLAARITDRERKKKPPAGIHPESTRIPNGNAAKPPPGPSLSADARAVLDYWRAAHGKRKAPQLNPKLIAALEQAVQELGVPALEEAADWSAEQEVPELIKAIRAAYTKRQRAETAAPAPRRGRGITANARDSRDPNDYFSTAARR